MESLLLIKEQQKPKKILKNKDMPIRTCLISNKKAEKSVFLRFTVQNNNLVFDKKRPATGRGGYVFPTVKNLEKLKSPQIKKKLIYFLKIKKLEISEQEIDRQITGI